MGCSVARPPNTTHPLRHPAERVCHIEGVRDYMYMDLIRCAHRERESVCVFYGECAYKAMGTLKLTLFKTAESDAMILCR